MTVSLSHRGFRIGHDADGLFWLHGGPCKTVTEVKEEIDYWVTEEDAFYVDIIAPPDGLASSATQKGAQK